MPRELTLSADQIDSGESEVSRARIQMRTTLYGGEDMQPLLQAEVCAVERINKDEWENVRGTIFKETGSTFNKATNGSLILHITPYSKKAYDKLLKFCKCGSFEKLLKNLLSDEKTKLLLPQGPITVKIELLAIGVIEESGRSDVAKFQDRLIEEIDTVVDEIDPMNFQKPFIERQLLSEAYFHQLFQSFTQNRSARAAAFVEKVLELGENAVITFMETIEKKGPEYLLGVLKKDSTMVVDIHDNDELIAKGTLKNKESTDSENIPFYETSFRITVQDSINSHGTQHTDSSEMLVTVVDNFKAKQQDIEIKTTRPRRSDTSDYESQYSPRSSGESKASVLTASDPATNLDGD